MSGVRCDLLSWYDDCVDLEADESDRVLLRAANWTCMPLLLPYWLLFIAW